MPLLPLSNHISHPSQLCHKAARSRAARNFSKQARSYSLLTWWRHQMETFSALLAICAGNSPVAGQFPAQRPVRRSFDVFFDLLCICINGCVNNREAGDFKRHCTHYDVTVMMYIHLPYYIILNPISSNTGATFNKAIYSVVWPLWVLLLSRHIFVDFVLNKI